MPCSKTSFLKLPSIHRFRCLVLSEIVTHHFTTKNLQSQWRAKFMNFWLTYFRSRFALCSLWSVIFLCLLCVYCTLLATPPPQKNLHRLLFSDPLGRTVYSHKDMKTIPYATFAVQTECIMGDLKLVSGKEVRAHPSHLFLIILLYGAMLPWDFFLAAYRRELWSRKYLLRTCIRKTAIWIKGCISFESFILLFSKICFLYLTDSYTKR